MAANALVQRLSKVQEQADQLRHLSDINPPNTVIYFADLDVIRDRVLVVEADGIGGAYAMVIEGNYPIDFVTHSKKDFQTENAAVTAAMRISEQRATPALISQ